MIAALAIASAGLAHGQDAAPPPPDAAPTPPAATAPPSADPATPVPATPSAPAAGGDEAPTATPAPADPDTASPDAASPDTANPDAAEPNIETPAIVIDGGETDTLLGKPVQSADGEDMGRIVDVIVDRGGMMRAAIIDFGGFLGVGSRQIAVDWRVLHFPRDGSMDKIVAELSRDQLRVAPVYKPGEPVVVVGRADAAPPQPPAAPSPAASISPPSAPEAGAASAKPPAAAAPAPPQQTP